MLPRIFVSWWSMPVACVTIRDSAGRPFVHVTESKTLFEAVQNSIEWFRDDYWHGPKPRRDTVYEVSLVGDDRRWKVRAASVERWRKLGSGPKR